MALIETRYGVASASLPAPLLAVGSMVSIQMAAALAQPVIQAMGPFALTSLRLAAAAAILLLLTRPWTTWQGMRSTASAFALGAALAGYSVCFFAATAWLPLGMVTTISFLGPLGLSLIATRRVLDGMIALLAAASVAILVWPQDQGWVTAPVGLALALASALCWAAYIVLTQKVGAAFSGMQGLAIAVTAAALIAAPVGLGTLTEWPDLRWIAVACALGLLSPLMTTGLEMLALRRMGKRPFGILMSLEPAIGVGVGLVVLEQIPGMAQGLGVLGVIVASALTVLLPAPAPREIPRADPA